MKNEPKWQHIKDCWGNGKLAREQFRINEKIHGISKIYFRNGELWIEDFNIYNEEHGLKICDAQDGRIRPSL